MSQNDISKLHESLCTHYPWLGLGPLVTTMQYVMYFRFCGYMLACNGLYDAWLRGRIVSDSPEGSTGGEVVMSRISAPLSRFINEFGAI